MRFLPLKVALLGDNHLSAPTQDPFGRLCEFVSEVGDRGVDGGSQGTGCLLYTSDAADE